MANNDWLKHFKGFEDSAKRFDDWVERCCVRQMSYVTPFLDENEQNILTRVVGHRVSLKFWGGYEGAERKRACLNGEEAISVVPLRANFSKFQKPSHRDCKGALYNCGVKSDQLGDILVNDQRVCVFVSENVKDHIQMNCTSIGRSKVSFHESNELIEVDQKMVVRSFIVSSTRLDAIVSCLAHCSRKQSVELIRNKCVSVNHVPLEDCSALCNNNCVLSIRGVGRFQYLGVTSMTKKENYVIEIGIYQ